MENTRRIKVGNAFIGGGAPVSVQSMTNTATADVVATVRQILSLEGLGCDIVRVTVNTPEAARALPEIKRQIHIPLVADIHYDYKLAVAAAEGGADKIRINPGNIGSDDKVKYLADFLNERDIPIRIGVNGGSLDSEFKGINEADALVLSAEKHIRLLENANFYNTIVSIKASDVRATVAACRNFRARHDYPLHIGVTEAGTNFSGTIKNAAAIGALLLDGIGDTVRVSLSGAPQDEVRVANTLLVSLGLRKGAQVIACPTCGRTEIPVVEIARQIEDEINPRLPVKIAVMGCVVNGIGEASDADLGVAGGREKSIIFWQGKKLKTVDNGSILQELKLLLEKYEEKL